MESNYILSLFELVFKIIKKGESKMTTYILVGIAVVVIIIALIVNTISRNKEVPCDGVCKRKIANKDLSEKVKIRFVESIHKSRKGRKTFIENNKEYFYGRLCRDCLDGLGKIGR